jgi:hypothetical protein
MAFNFFVLINVMQTISQNPYQGKICDKVAIYDKISRQNGLFVMKSRPLIAQIVADEWT